MSEIRNPSLAAEGEKKLSWAWANMPLLRALEREFSAEKPFSGMKISLSIHLEAKTANLCRLLKTGGAEMHVTGSNPLSTQDDVAAALASGGVNVYAWHGAHKKIANCCYNQSNPQRIPLLKHSTLHF